MKVILKENQNSGKTHNIFITELKKQALPPGFHSPQPWELGKKI